MLDNILNDFAYGAKQIFGTVDVEVILFGSYSRSDFDTDSDVDVAILADIPRENERDYTNDIVSLISKIDNDYGYSFLISPIVISKSFFEEWRETIPFYKTLKNEGVKIDVA
ncbi:MAG: nucleotidyltransferase domain-containing protein [Defluviitaleaceae bacterium]|nr:nucleotidyltransferase domain-containing protein [Defluviitaleaceae bacterium]